MDKLKKYEAIVCDVLAEYGAIKKRLTPNVQSQKVIDRVGKHFQLISVGWHNGNRVYTIAFHFDIIDEKIWIQQNNTDVLIADELVERGVSASDIVLGFIDEQYRQQSGFAAQ